MNNTIHSLRDHTRNPSRAYIQKKKKIISKPSRENYVPLRPTVYIKRIIIIIIVVINNKYSGEIHYRRLFDFTPSIISARTIHTSITNEFQSDFTWKRPRFGCVVLRGWKKTIFFFLFSLTIPHARDLVRGRRANDTPPPPSTYGRPPRLPTGTRFTRAAG